MTITPSLRLLWMAATNPEPLPSSWIESQITEKPITLIAQNSREIFAICEGALRGLFVIHTCTVNKGNSGNTYSISYPQPKQQCLL